MKKNWGYLTLNYSYYEVTSDDIDDYKVIDFRTNAVVDDKMRLAFPSHKITLNGSYQLTPQFSINPSIVFYGKRYGYDTFDASGETLLLREYSASTLANVFFKYDDLFVKNLDVGLGIYNIFDEDYDFIQPYNSAHAPLPDLSREILLKVAYQF